MQETSTQPPWSQHYPAGLAFDKKYTPRTLPDMFDTAVATYGDQVCSEFLGSTRTYREIGQLVDRAARGLADLGIGKGSKVGVTASQYANLHHFLLCRLEDRRLCGELQSPLHRERACVSGWG